MTLRFPRATALLALAALGPASACRRAPLAPQEAFSRYCVQCHGADGHGDSRTIGPVPHLDLFESEWLARRDIAEVTQRIHDGHGRMPGFSTKLTSAEIAALAAFTIERFGSPETPAEGR